ncbi:MAG: 7-carboxy-7-deazaguanine synthase QueE [Bacteroidetes bacterium]|nr:7-carboxy-7-deazaguanine synthase QueE [Bacteroidota bacterium]
MEHFYTLQGEGAWAGTAAYFIRLGGCDVGCHWCDVKESWPVGAHPHLAVKELVAAVLATPCRRVVVTGGEPLMHDCTALTQVLRAAGCTLAIETSGAYPLSGSWDWICFSPKKFKAPLPEIYPQAHELKIVVYNLHDLAWAETHARQVNSRCKLYLQPEWSRQESAGWIVDYVKAHPHWQISLQTHKFLDIP